MKISEIAKLSGYSFCGKDFNVDSIRYAEYAEDTSIAIIKNIDSINKTKARCILVEPKIIDIDKTIIFTGDPIEIAIVKIAQVLEDSKNNFNELSIHQKVDNYFLGKNVIIGSDTIIAPNVFIDNNAVIGHRCYIGPNSYIGSDSIIKDNVSIGASSTIGANSFYHYYENDCLHELKGLGRVIIEKNVSIGSNTVIQKGTFSDTKIGESCKIGNLIDIGHDVIIGNNCKIVSQTGIASNVKIKNNVTIYGQVGISNDISIEDNACIYAKSLVCKNVKSNEIVSGIYACNHLDNLKMIVKLRRL